MSLIRLFFGRTKSGKSFKAQKESKDFSKVVIYDFAHCFNDGFVIEDLSTKYLAKVLAKFGGAKNRKKKFRLIFRRPVDSLHHDALERVSTFVKHLGRSYGVRALPESDLMVFIVDEADKCTTKKDNDNVRQLVQAGRHDNVSTWAIAQRPMNLHPDFRDNATQIYAFKLGPNDFYKKRFGDSAINELMGAPEYCFLNWTDTGKLDLVSVAGKQKDVSKM